jgi:hypothetical protein
MAINRRLSVRLAGRKSPPVQTVPDAVTPFNDALMARGRELVGEGSGRTPRHVAIIGEFRQGCGGLGRQLRLKHQERSPREGQTSQAGSVYMETMTDSLGTKRLNLREEVANAGWKVGRVANFC